MLVLVLVSLDLILGKKMKYKVQIQWVMLTME